MARKGLAIFAVFVAGSAATAQSDPPVGVAVGDVLFEAADTETGEQARFYVGYFPTALGSYALSTGETLTLEPGSGPIGRFRRPEIQVGSGGSATEPGGLGAFVISGDSVVELIGDNGGPSVFIGEEWGTGSFTIASGALLRLFDDGIRELDVSIGEDGAKVQVGRAFGTGTLNLDDGQLEIIATTRALLTVGSEPGGAGTMTMSNGAGVLVREIEAADAISSNADVLIGIETGTGIFDIVDSTLTVESVPGLANLTIGYLGGTGSLNLSGDGAIAEVTGIGASVLVGRRDGSVGTLNISDGAVMEVAAIGGNDDPRLDDARLRIGSDGTNTGVVNVTGGGRILVGSDSAPGRIYVGDDEAEAGESGVGVLTLSGIGTTVKATDVVTIAKRSGEGTSSGIVSVSAGASLVSPTISVFEGGTLKGDGGSIFGDVFVEAGGSVQPGLSPGRLTINGDVLFGTGSLLAIELAGSGEGDYDVLDVVGDLLATGPFSIVLQAVSGFIPTEGQTFDFLRVSGSISENFSQFAMLDFSGVPGGGALTFDPLTGNVAFSTAGTAPAVISLPASVLFLFSGLCGLALLRRRGRTT
jgi:hypothetical protein